jgi:hypothetical protein
VGKPDKPAVGGLDLIGGGVLVDTQYLVRLAVSGHASPRSELIKVLTRLPDLGEHDWTGASRV